MTHYNIIFKEKIIRTDSVVSFRFDFFEKINFMAGQFAQLIFDENNLNNKNLSKYISFSSSPNNSYIEFTKRLSTSDFSNKLSALNKGDKLLINGPIGQCIFDKTIKKAAFISGGIGITPVMSILEYCIDIKVQCDFQILYLNKNIAEIAFKSILDKWSMENENINLINAIEDGMIEAKPYLVGRINNDMLKDAIPDYISRHIFIFGPPIMVKITNDICLSLGCDPKNLTTENFVGY